MNWADVDLTEIINYSFNKARVIKHKTGEGQSSAKFFLAALHLRYTTRCVSSSLVCCIFISAHSQCQLKPSVWDHPPQASLITTSHLPLASNLDCCWLPRSDASQRSSTRSLVRSHCSYCGFGG